MPERPGLRRSWLCRVGIHRYGGFIYGICECGKRKR
jgi:hypothetical protein